MVTYRGVNITGARIEGDLNLADAKIPFPLYLESSSLSAPLILDNAELSSLSLSGSRTRSISAEGVKIHGNAWLDYGFRNEGEVSLLGAKIEGALACAGGQFVNPGGRALTADGMTVGRVLLREGFRAEGEVFLMGAIIAEELDCDSGQFVNPGGRALTADGMTVERVLLRKGFRAEGEVFLMGAKIEGDLDCDGGKFVNAGGRALTADTITVRRNLLLRDGFRADGTVFLLGAKITGALSTVGGDFSSGSLDLRLATVGVLQDKRASWPERGRLFVDGFVYGAIADNSPVSARHRVDWLEHETRFSPQSYEALASVLKRGGYEAEATRILIAENRRRAHEPQATWSAWLWYGCRVGEIIGYGYRPLGAFWAGLFVVILGGGLFAWGARSHLMVPTTDSAQHTGSTGVDLPDGYPPFHPFVYSLDAFTPLLDLGQADNWGPTARSPLGKMLLYYLWLHIMAGWILSTLLALGLSGLVRS
jgi:hypothetical protein